MRRLAILAILLPACTIHVRTDPQPVPTPVPTAAASSTPVPTPVVRPLTSGRVTFRISGVESLRFGYPPAGTDNKILLTMQCAEGNVECSALELALRGDQNEPCAARPCKGKFAISARYSPWIGADSRLYQTKRDRPESDYFGEGLKGPSWVPVGRAEPDGSYLVTVSWDGAGVVVSTNGGSSRALVGRCPGAASFGHWIEGVPEPPIGWGRKQWQASNEGASVSLLSWQPLGSQPPRRPCVGAP